MTLNECCALAQDMTRIPITVLQTSTDCMLFCTQYQFHPLQEYLLPHIMKLFLEGLSENETVCVTDPFHIKTLFFRIGSVPLVLGPFCTEFYSLNDCESLLRQIELKTFLRKNWLHTGARSRWRQSPISSISFTACSARWRPPFQKISEKSITTRRTSVLFFQDVDSTVPYAELVAQRYALEAALMTAVENGNVVKALESWNELHNSVAFLKRLGQTLESARVSAAITRTVIRIGAMHAGIPPIVNDRLSSASASIIWDAHTIDEINQEHERLIREYCQTIRRKKTTSYSNLTISALYYLEHSYARAVTVQNMATELDVSPNHLISLFKKEVGITPLAYLNRIRMQHAAHSLAHSRAPIHEIAESVGIMDANYFVKRFKAEFQDTPSQYRAKYFQ